MPWSNPSFAIEHSYVGERGVCYQAFPNNDDFVTLFFLSRKAVQFSSVCAFERIIYLIIPHYPQSSYLTQSVGSILNFLYALRAIHNPRFAQAKGGCRSQELSERRRRHFHKEMPKSPLQSRLMIRKVHRHTIHHLDGFDKTRCHCLFAHPHNRKIHLS